MAYGYDRMVREFGAVLVEVEDDDYQGDTRYLLREGRHYGVLTVGWGSCSGCDAYQAAEGNPAELRQLGEELKSQIHWERGADAMLAYLQGDHSLKHGTWAKFIEQAQAKLTEIVMEG